MTKKNIVVDAPGANTTNIETNTTNIVVLETIKGFANIATVGAVYSANGKEFEVLQTLTSVQTEGKGALVETSLQPGKLIRFETLQRELFGSMWEVVKRDSTLKGAKFGTWAKSAIVTAKPLTDDELANSITYEINKVYSDLQTAVQTAIDNLNTFKSDRDITEGDSDEVISEKITNSRKAWNIEAKENLSKQIEAVKLKELQKSKSKADLAGELQTLKDREAKRAILNAQLLEALTNEDLTAAAAITKELTEL